MNGKFSKALLKFHKGEKGITGLETAIILIAFVTVAAVLAYSVLSAGIFSSERGQEAVYSGLEQAQASMQVNGGVKAESTDSTNVSTIKFAISSVLADKDIDIGKIIMNYTDDAVFVADVDFTFDNLAAGGSDEMLGPDEIGMVTLAMVNVSGGVLTAYDTFTLELIPLTGATVTIQRTLPGDIETVMDLH